MPFTLDRTTALTVLGTAATGEILGADTEVMVEFRGEELPQPADEPAVVVLFLNSPGVSSRRIEGDADATEPRVAGAMLLDEAFESSGSGMRVSIRFVS